jgi:hypothetical protein
MNSPNTRDQVGRALELLAAGLAPFVQERMVAARGLDWFDSFRDRSGPDLERALVDPRFLLKVMTSAWNDAFSPPLSRRERTLVFELRETGNLWAHSEPFDWDDVDRAFDSVVRLLRPVDAQAGSGADRRELSRVGRWSLGRARPPDVLLLGWLGGRTDRLSALILLTEPEDLGVNGSE